jgi:DNA-3-methyladenine glycosylase II
VPLHALVPAVPYSLERTVRPFARFPEELVDLVHGRSFRRAFHAGDGYVLLQASQEESGDLDRPVVIDVLAVDGSPIIDEAVTSLSRMLAVNEAIDPVYRLMKDRLELEYISRHLRGLRRTLDPTPFEGLVFSILAQLISIRGAAVVRSRFVQAFGASIHFEGQDYWSFPEPAAVQNASIDQLCGLGMTGAKARAIQTVARLAASGELDLHQLTQQSDSEVLAHLISLPGIGPWTAEWFLIRVLGRMAIVPAGDLGIRRVTGKWLLNGDMPSAAEVREVYEPFGDLRGYVAYYVLSAERVQLQMPGATGAGSPDA